MDLLISQRWCRFFAIFMMFLLVGCAGTDDEIAADASVNQNPDGECADGETREGTTSCEGLDTLMSQSCVDGAWVDDTASCEEEVADCEEGATRLGETPCGLNGEGVFNQDCTEGAWTDNESCTGTDVCENGTSQPGSTVCGLNGEGFFNQDCSEGAWADNTTCTGTDQFTEAVPPTAADDTCTSTSLSPIPLRRFTFAETTTRPSGSFAAVGAWA